MSSHSPNSSKSSHSSHSSSLFHQEQNNILKCCNISIGPYALTNVDTRTQSNLSIGDYALHACTSGSMNIALGNASCEKIIHAHRCIGIGHSALSNIQYQFVSDDCTCIGHHALSKLTVGNSNLCMGSLGLASLAEGKCNLSIGHYTGQHLKQGDLNILHGNYSGNKIAYMSQNLILGHYACNALPASSSDEKNIENCLSIGHYNLTQFTNIASLCVIGLNAVNLLQQGKYITMVGNDAYSSCLTGEGTSGFGYKVLNQNWGSFNTCMGAFSLSNQASTASHCTSIGYKSQEDASGSMNIALGSHALTKIQNNDNIAIGCYAAEQLLNGKYNIIQGSHCIQQTRKVDQCILLGHHITLDKDDIQYAIGIGNMAHLSHDGELAIGSVQCPIKCGAASPLPEKPDLYMCITLNGEKYQIPLYKQLRE